MKAQFFATAIEFRKWLEQHHDKQGELLVGFYKRDSGRPSMTWPESVDEALCFGWIDGVRHRTDEVSYTIRFTPRKKRSIWSAVNMTRVAELTKLGLMHPSGVGAFEARSAERSAIYSFEQENIAFEAAQEKLFRGHKDAWNYFQTQANWYRRAATWWVISAKREETKAKRLATLMADSAVKRTLKHLTRQPKASVRKMEKLQKEAV